MQVGVQFFPGVSPAEKSPQDYFDECLSLVEEADALGFSHARMVEHHFQPHGGYSPNPIVFLAAAAQRTRRMRLITGAVLPVFTHPLKLAGEIGMLDAISHGRLDVGFARAFLLQEFEQFGISPDESRARFEEGLAQVKLLLTEENVSHSGRFHQIRDTTTLPRPTQKPRPKFYIAANLNEETFAFAGREGHAVMAIPLGAKMRPLVAAYRAAWRDAGHPGDGEVMLAFHMFADADGARARAIAKQPFQDYFKHFAAATKEWTDGATSVDYPDYGPAMARVSAITLEHQIEGGGAWVGSPAEILAQIERVTETIGAFEQASIQVNFGVLPFAEAQRSLRLFATEVLPKVS